MCHSISDTGRQTQRDRHRETATGRQIQDTDRETDTGRQTQGDKYSEIPDHLVSVILQIHHIK